MHSPKISPGRSPHLSRDAAFSVELLDSLAWATRHRIPIPTALRGFFNLRGISKAFRWLGVLIGWFFRLPLMAWLYPLLLILVVIITALVYGNYHDGPEALSLFLLLIPLAFLLPVHRIAWNWRLNNLLLDLRKGHPLHHALRRNLGHIYPGYVFSAIAAAEERGTLDTALPHLASQLQRTREIHQTRGIPYMVVFIKILFCLSFFTFYLLAIAPRMVEITADVGLETTSIIHQTIWPTALGLQFILGLLATLFLLCYLLPGLRRRVVIWIPILRREAKRIFLCDTACSMAHHLRQGQTMLQAADHTLAGCRTRWQKKRIAAFRDAIAVGHPWNHAWNQLALGNHLDHWFADVAAAREQPAEAFENMLHWAEHDIGKTTIAILRWIDPIVTAILAILTVWLSIKLFFLPLRSILEGLQRAVTG